MFDEPEELSTEGLPVMERITAACLRSLIEYRILHGTKTKHAQELRQSRKA